MGALKASWERFGLTLSSLGSDFCVLERSWTDFLSILDYFWWISGYIPSEFWRLIACVRMRLLNDVQIAKTSKNHSKIQVFQGCAFIQR